MCSNQGVIANCSERAGNTWKIAGELTGEVCCSDRGICVLGKEKSSYKLLVSSPKEETHRQHRTWPPEQHVSAGPEEESGGPCSGSERSGGRACTGQCARGQGVVCKEQGVQGTECAQGQSVHGLWCAGGRGEK